MKNEFGVVFHEGKGGWFRVLFVVMYSKKGKNERNERMS